LVQRHQLLLLNPEVLSVRSHLSHQLNLEVPLGHWLRSHLSHQLHQKHLSHQLNLEVRLGRLLPWLRWLPSHLEPQWLPSVR
jgi:hypothetical protein